MKKKVIKTILLITLIIYAVITFINQQITLNRYEENQTKLSQEIQEESEHKEKLVATKNNVDSTEFIEEMAREKLDMYYPTEKVYVDQGK